MSEEMSDRGIARLLHDIVTWESIVNVDRALVYLDVSRHNRTRRSRGVLSFLTETRFEFGFSWGNWNPPPLDDVKPSRATR